LIGLRLGPCAATDEFLITLGVGTRLIALRLLGLDALIEAAHLELQLLIANEGNLGTRIDRLAFLDLELFDNAANPRPCRQEPTRFDGGNNRLVILNGTPLDSNLTGKRRRD
jgi:hypothetical protein